MFLDPSLVQGNVDAIRTLFNSLITLLPSGLTIQVPNSGDILTAETGVISGTWSVATLPTVVTGSAVGAYSGTSGAVLHWLTGSVILGRRVRGRTFIVPLTGTAYDTLGSLSTSAQTTLANAASTYVTAQAGLAKVWSRPRPGQTGAASSITGSRVPDLAVALRSRRI